MDFSTFIYSAHSVESILFHPHFLRELELNNQQLLGVLLRSTSFTELLHLFVAKDPPHIIQTKRYQRHYLAWKALSQHLSSLQNKLLSRDSLAILLDSLTSERPPDSPQAWYIVSLMKSLLPIGLSDILDYLKAHRTVAQLVSVLKIYPLTSLLKAVIDAIYDQMGALALVDWLHETSLLSILLSSVLSCDTSTHLSAVIEVFHHAIQRLSDNAHQDHIWQFLDRSMAERVLAVYQQQSPTSTVAIMTLMKQIIVTIFAASFGSSVGSLDNCPPFISLTILDQLPFYAELLSSSSVVVVHAASSLISELTHSQLGSCLLSAFTHHICQSSCYSVADQPPPSSISSPLPSDSIQSPINQCFCCRLIQKCVDSPRLSVVHTSLLEIACGLIQHRPSSFVVFFLAHTGLITTVADLLFVPTPIPSLFSPHLASGRHRFHRQAPVLVKKRTIDPNLIALARQLFSDIEHAGSKHPSVADLINTRTTRWDDIRNQHVQREAPVQSTFKLRDPFHPYLAPFSSESVLPPVQPAPAPILKKSELKADSHLTSSARRNLFQQVDEEMMGMWGHNTSDSDDDSSADSDE
ncbi:hypothetical protein BLNAU_15668 [Blattamonas nauphoetae]|uniref:Uncharacterized protein n=1 Tax=Blattamonas nauphoetae TaxID=2049346 RepID=A0ABQ9X9Z5_9EUKA|nr:hypothetical protein BLNAU_15668 [Blattamonas nauphoetae]